MFPAGAGMNRHFRPYWIAYDNVPRRRGDEPVYRTGQLFRVCSPQARG